MVIDDGVPKILPEMSAHFHQNLSQWQTIETFSCSPKDWKESVMILLIIAFSINKYI